MDNDKYIGRLLDNRYEVLEVIGVGGMAVVYKARCHRLNRLVAIKILKDEYSKDEDFCHRFHAEGQAVAMVSHPNIVSVYDVSSSHDADYIVMELIDGISLKQYMEKKGVLNWKETLHFAIQIGKALEHAHGRGIVHRDIKPHNVMVLKNGSVKVTDFGIARLMSESHTLTRETLGSVHYISPEQAKGGRVDNRSDLYSLGVVMYEIMTGRPPYNGESPVAVAIQHINGGAAMPSTLNPNIPGSLEQIIMKTMAHDPAKRYSSATEMLYDMDEFRKNPVLLFDYNTPPTDAVLNISNTGSIPVTQNPAPRTTAERVVSEKTDMPRRTAPSGTPQRRRPSGSTNPRRRHQPARDDNRMATVAVIACSAVAVIALAVFLLVLLSGGCSAGDRDMIQVPDLLGQDYEQIQNKYAYNANIHIKLNSDKNFSYSDSYEKGQIMDQKPASGTQVAKGTVVYVTVSLGKEPENVTMDNHIGKTQDEAKGYLDALKLGLQISVKEEFSDDFEKGTVIRTDPAEGERLTNGSVVVLYVSKGPEIVEIEMIDLTDRSLEAAKEWLNNQKLDLTIKVEEKEDLEVEEGKILSTKPAAGQKIKTGDTVTIYIAKGMKSDYMPSLAGMTVEDALKAMETLEKDLKLTLEQVEEYDKNVELGKVTRTEPAFNEGIKTGDTVKIYVSGKQKAKMPNVEGKSLQNALDILEYAGFANVKYDTYVVSDKPKDTVVSQSVPKDQEVAVDTEIVLTLSKGYQEVSVLQVVELFDNKGQYTETITVVITNVTTGQVVYNEQLEATESTAKIIFTGWGVMDYSITVNGENTGTIQIDFDNP